MPAATVIVLRLIRQRHEAVGALWGNMIGASSKSSQCEPSWWLDEIKPAFAIHSFSASDGEKVAQPDEVTQTSRIAANSNFSLRLNGERIKGEVSKLFNREPCQTREHQFICAEGATEISPGLEQRDYPG